MNAVRRLERDSGGRTRAAEGDGAASLEWRMFRGGGERTARGGGERIVGGIDAEEGASTASPEWRRFRCGGG